MIALTFCSGGEGAVYQYGEIPKPCVFVQIPRGFSQTEVEEKERERERERGGGVT